MRLDSGVCNSVSVLSNALFEKGHDVYIATLQGRGPLINILLIPKSNIIDLSRDKTIFGKILHLKKCIRNNHIDIVHCHMHKPGIVGRMSALGESCKTVVTEHSSHLPFKHWWSGFLENAIDSYLARKTNHFVAVSNSAAVAFASRTYIAPNFIKVIPNPLDLKRFGNIELKAHNVKSNNKKILFIGRLAYEKNLDLLIQIFECLHDENSSVTLTIAGSGYMENELKNTIEVRGLSNSIELLGAVDNVHELMSKADLLLVTSHWEGFPVSILEAHASGLPVVATNVPGVTDLITHEVNGLLFNPTEPCAGKDQIVRVLNREKIIELVIKNGLSRIRLYSPQNVADQYVKLYVR